VSVIGYGVREVCSGRSTAKRNTRASYELVIPRPGRPIAMSSTWRSRAYSRAAARSFDRGHLTTPYGTCRSFNCEGSIDCQFLCGRLGWLELVAKPSSLSSRGNYIPASEKSGIGEQSPAARQNTRKLLRRPRQEFSGRLTGAVPRLHPLSPSGLIACSGSCRSCCQKATLQRN